MKYIPITIILTLTFSYSYDVGLYLTQIGNRVATLLENPHQKEKKEMFGYIYDYIETLKDLIDQLDRNKENAFRAAKFLVKRGKPLYPELQLDEERLTEVYNWTQKEIDDYYRLSNETDIIWDEFEIAYTRITQHFDNTPSPYDE